MTPDQIVRAIADSNPLISAHYSYDSQDVCAYCRGWQGSPGCWWDPRHGSMHTSACQYDEAPCDLPTRPGDGVDHRDDCVWVAAREAVSS